MELTPLDSNPNNSTNTKLGVKRPCPTDSEDSKGAVKRIALVNSRSPKSAMCLIHELYKGVEFKIVNQEGPVNTPTFTALVEINGIVFEGKGGNKKAAKHSAAEAALRYNCFYFCIGLKLN